MKICDIVQFYSPLSGGVKRYINDKIEFLSRCPHHDHIVIIPSKRTTTRRDKNSLVCEVESPPLIGSKSYRILLSKKRIVDILRTHRPDIIEVGDPYRAAWIALDAGRTMGIPVVAVYHSDYPRALDRTFQRFGGALVGKVLARSIDRYLVHLYNNMAATVVLTKQFFNTLANMDVRRLVHIPLGTNPKVFYPRNVRRQIFQELKLSLNTKLLVYVGRFAREKNIHHLLAMMDTLRTYGQSFHLLLVGDGELRSEVLHRVQTGNDTSWIPYTEDAGRLADIYSSADLFVHAGMSETFGLVTLEAQCCGTRVLIVKNSGMDEVVEGEDPCIMAESTNPGDLAAAVQLCLSLNEDGHTRRNRRKRIVENFTYTNTYTNFINLYTNILDCYSSPYACVSEAYDTFDHSYNDQALSVGRS